MDGETLRAARKKWELTQIDFGERFLQKDVTTIRRWESDRGDIPPEIAMLIAVMLKAGIAPAQARKLAKLEPM